MTVRKAVQQIPRPKSIDSELKKEKDNEITLEIQLETTTICKKVYF